MEVARIYTQKSSTSSSSSVNDDSACFTLMQPNA